MVQAQQSRTARPFGFDAKPEGAQHGAIASQQRTQPGAARGYGAKNCPRNPDGTSPVLGGECLRPANGPNLEQHLALYVYTFLHRRIVLLAHRSYLRCKSASV